MKPTTRLHSHVHNSGESPFEMKVMRLCSPTLALSKSVSWAIEEVQDPDALSYLTDQVDHSFFSDPSSESIGKASEAKALLSSLRLNSKLETAYVGEIFQTWLSVINLSSNPVKNCSIRIELIFPPEHGKQKCVLVGSPSHKVFDFNSGEAKDYIVHPVLSTPGDHTLSCIVGYTEKVRIREEENFQTMKKEFRKKFNFKVKLPFTIMTEMHIRDEFILAQSNIKSNLRCPIFIDEVKLLAGGDAANRDNVHFEDLNSIDLQNTSSYESKDTTGQPSSMSTFGLVCPMTPSDYRAYLFAVHLKQPRQQRWSKLTNKILRNLQIRVGWRSGINPTSFYQTAINAKNMPRAEKEASRKEYDLLIVEAPDQVKLQKPFTVTILVRSISARMFDLRLRLLKERMGNIMPCGVSSRSLGNFEACSTKQFQVNLLPLGLGVQRITGFMLSSTKLGTSMNFDNLHQLQVIA